MVEKRLSMFEMEGNSYFAVVLRRAGAPVAPSTLEASFDARAGIEQIAQRVSNEIE